MAPAHQVDKAEARHEISRLIYGYSEALDGGDLECVGEILKHCVIRVPQNDLEVRGAAAIRKMFEDYTIFYEKTGARAHPDVPSAHPHTCHFVANLLIDVDDDGLHASSKSYVIVFQAKDGVHWFGSNGRGVYRFDGKTIVRFTTDHGLGGDHVQGIQGDRSGNIYVYSNPGGICRFDGRAFSTLRVADPSMNEWRLEPDDLWFPGAQESGDTTAHG